MEVGINSRSSMLFRVLFKNFLIWLFSKMLHLVSQLPHYPSSFCLPLPPPPPQQFARLLWWLARTRHQPHHSNQLAETRLSKSILVLKYWGKTNLNLNVVNARGEVLNDKGIVESLHGSEHSSIHDGVVTWKDIPFKKIEALNFFFLKYRFFSERQNLHFSRTSLFCK